MIELYINLESVQTFMNGNTVSAYATGNENMVKLTLNLEDIVVKTIASHYPINLVHLTLNKKKFKEELDNE